MSGRRRNRRCCARLVLLIRTGRPQIATAAAAGAPSVSVAGRERERERDRWTTHLSGSRPALPIHLTLTVFILFKSDSFFFFLSAQTNCLIVFFAWKLRVRFPQKMKPSFNLFQTLRASWMLRPPSGHMTPLIYDMLTIYIRQSAGRRSGPLGCREFVPIVLRRDNRSSPGCVNISNLIVVFNACHQRRRNSKSSAAEICNCRSHSQSI